jgi:hypothetical protein
MKSRYKNHNLSMGDKDLYEPLKCIIDGYLIIPKSFYYH